MIDWSAERLLRRHVGHGPEDHARHGDLRLRDFGLGLDRVPDELREAEVEHLHQPAARPHQVRALDVAMNDPARVGLVQRVGDLHADFDDFVERQWSFRDARRQQFTLDVLHDDEVGAGELADIERDGDIGRSKQRRGARLVEAGPAVGIGA
jgi:hypothetical protein